MSEVINNREYRQKVLKELIRELHNGKSVEEIKPRFEELIQGISVAEITEMEQMLIMEGMPVEEIQRLCDVHAAVFKGSIEEIHKPQNPEEVPGHPIHTFKLENAEIEKLINSEMSYREVSEAVTGLTNQSISHQGVWNLVQAVGERLAKAWEK
jgi:DUF438 domain-containing protein